jgi:hypothetical protein
MLARTFFFGTIASCSGVPDRPAAKIDDGEYKIELRWHVLCLWELLWFCVCRLIASAGHTPAKFSASRTGILTTFRTTALQARRELAK